MKPGSYCKLSILNGSPVNAQVLQVCIKAGGYVQYQVAYWDKSSRVDAWVESFEVSVCMGEMAKIGFFVPDPPPPHAPPPPPPGGKLNW